MSANMLTGLGGVATNTFMILLTVVFILLEAAGFRAKFQAAMEAPDRALANFSEFTESVNRYLAIKTAVSLATGLVITVWLAILGVDYPVLWGLLAFFLNFVPNIGSIIASIPAVLLSLVQFGIGKTIAVAVGYLVVNLVVGSIIEPKFMGQGIGKKLGEKLFDYYKALGIENVYTSVRWDSTDLLSFFKTLGFDRGNFINLRKQI